MDSEIKLIDKVVIRDKIAFCQFVCICSIS